MVYDKDTKNFEEFTSNFADNILKIMNKEVNKKSEELYPTKPQTIQKKVIKTSLLLQYIKNFD